MRASSAIAAAGMALALLGADSAAAAPTCLDREGAAVRCGAPGSMPVGWVPPAGQAVPPGDAPSPRLGELAGLAAVLVGLFALIGLMPEFDGWEARDRDDD